MNPQNSLELLRNLPLFRGLNDEELKKIEQILIRRKLKNRMVIFMQGESLDYIYFIVKGTVKTYRSDEQGREQIINVLQPGDMFPHVGFFRNGVYPAHALMIEDGVLLALPTARFHALLESSPVLSLKLLTVMESKIQELQGRLEEMMMHDTFGRIVYLLSRLSKSHGVPAGDRVRIDVPFTNLDLANMIGTSRETVSRVFSQLKKARVLEITSDHYILVSPERLAKQMPA